MLSCLDLSIAAEIENSMLIVVDHTILVGRCRCRNSQLSQFRWEELQVRGTCPNSDVEAGNCNLRLYVAGKCLKAGLQAFGHNTSLPSKAWHEDLEAHLVKLVSCSRIKIDCTIPCLLIVSPYVRANFGRRFPILS